MQQGFNAIKIKGGKPIRVQGKKTIKQFLFL